jgi:hypothetical protein
VRQQSPLSITMPAPQSLIAIEELQIGWIAYLANLADIINFDI